MQSEMGRVGNWRSSRGSISSSPTSVGSRTGAVLGIARFQPPPRQTRRTGLPYRAFLSASSKGLWDLSAGSAFNPVVPHPVFMEKTQRRIHPGSTPPVPAEATALPCTHKVPPDLFLHPVFDIAKAGAGVPDPKIIHPAPQNWIDQGYHPTHGLGVEAPKHFLEFPKKSRPGLLSRREPNSPLPPPRFSSPKVKGKKKNGFFCLNPTFLTLKSPF